MNIISEHYKRNKRNPHLNKVWHDQECFIKERSWKKAMNDWRHNPTSKQLNSMLVAKKEYKSICKRKKYQNEIEIGSKLAQLRKQNGKEFWKLIKKMDTNHNKNEIPESIKIEDWCLHFKQLHETPVSQNAEPTPDNTTINSVNSTEGLNEPICLDEVRFAIQRMKNDKAPGADGIMVEVLKCACLNNPSIQFLTDIFSRIHVTLLYR